jgi:serine/threonine protein kinase
MEPERWQQISGIFKSALALKPEERPAYVADKCGDDESLRHQVEQLIESHQQADQHSFIESHAVAEVASLLVPDSPAEVPDSLEKGQQIAHYRIVRKLGEGGMGEVYLAEDTRLDRTVALKIVPADLASDKRRMQRFKQEAKLASSLNQPNILTIYEFGDIDSLHFIASEYVDGTTLRYYVKENQLKLPEIIDIGIQVVAALDAAHEARIVHRDIKPENIMVRRRDKVIKVLDFGLAKLTERVSGRSVRSETEANTAVMVRTMPGSVMGTVYYMSPEQAQGLHIDERTDLWSVGVVIYEMVTGTVPFVGVTSSHTIVDILEKEPPPLGKPGARAVPPELQRIVSKALAKDPGERYQTAKDMLIDLRNLKRRLELESEIERTGSIHPGLPAAKPAESENVRAGSLDTSPSKPGLSESKLRSHWLLFAGLPLILILVVGLIIAGNWSRFRQSTTTGPSPPITANELKLSYWMTVQKYRNGRAFENPFRLAGEINFEKDYKVKLNVTSRQTGHLYILNEGPSARDGSLSFVVLFPSTTANNGSSYVAQNQSVEIPQQSWFQFDAEQGTEKLWLVFSVESLPEMEAVRKFANPQDQGVIKDADLQSKVQQFLRTHADTKPTTEKSDELQETSVRAATPVLVHPIRLEHH